VVRAGSSSWPGPACRGAGAGPWQGDGLQLLVLACHSPWGACHSTVWQGLVSLLLQGEAGGPSRRGAVGGRLPGAGSPLGLHVLIGVSSQLGSQAAGGPSRAAAPRLRKGCAAGSEGA
jgi:hypothetical protein